MERLRHVARSGGADPALLVAETVDAVTSLCPAPSELVSLCRNLVERNPTCGPLWWLCARWLAKPEAIDAAWTWAEELERDPTPARLAESLPDEGVVMTVGHPAVTARALRRGGNVSVLAVMAGDGGSGLVRTMDRAGVHVEPVAPETMLATTRRADLVVIEADACSTDVVVASIGSGLAAVAAAAARTPVWLVAGRGRRLPTSYVDAVVQGLDVDHEAFSTTYVTAVVGPQGLVRMSAEALGSECPAVPELLT